MWTTPAATEMRFGFEVTMYVMNKQYILCIYTHDASAEMYASSFFWAVKPTLEDVVSNEFFGFLRYM